MGTARRLSGGVLASEPKDHPCAREVCTTYPALFFLSLAFGVQTLIPMLSRQACTD